MTLKGRLLTAVIAAIALVLAALTAGYNIVLADRVDADASGVVQARASAELAALDINGNRIALGETPDSTGRDTQIWVFQGTKALEQPQSAAEADNMTAAAMALARPMTRDVATTRTRLYSLPVIAAGHRVGTVIAGISLAPYDQTRHTALSASLVLALLALSAVALASWWLTSRALRPVAQMTAQAAEWSDRNIDQRFSLGEPRDELTQLAFTLDRLLDRLAASLRREQRLSAELSHELRTPLANIAAHAQYALRHSEQDENGRHALQQILNSTTQMARTLDTLIAAARAELDPSRARSDAAAGARAAAAEQAPMARERGIKLTLQTPSPPATVAAEQQLVERILAPIIENAYRYASTSVRITILSDGAKAQFTIDDDGPGIPDSEHETIFEPGRRGSAASGATTTIATTGAGLGLALSRRLARTAGGEVEAKHCGTGGRFVVTLPA